MRRWLPLFALLLATASAQAGPYDTLLKVVPSTANTLVLIDTEGIYKSAAAQKLGWAKMFADRFRAGATTIPPESKRIVIAPNTNARTFTREWQVALAAMPQVPNVGAVANREGGTVDTIGDRAAALSPREVYFTTLSEQESATWYPANRQLLAHWLRGVKAGRAYELSPYFQQVVKDQGEKAHLTMALDLTDAFDFASVLAWLEDARALAGRGDKKPDGVAKMIAQMHGLTLAVTVTDKLEATLRADFAVDADIHKTVLKNLLLEALEDEGLGMSELAAWETTFEGKAMILKGSFEPTMLGRLLALFEFPQESDGSTAPTAGDKPNGEASKKYLQAVLACLDEVRALKDKKDYEKTAAWHETYARKITQISTRSVDPAAVTFATATAARLQSIAGSLRGVPIDVKALAAGAYAYRTVHPSGGWGWRGRGAWVNLHTNVPQTNASINKVIAEEAKNRAAIWSQIENATVEVRQKLSAAYGMKF